MGRIKRPYILFLTILITTLTPSTPVSSTWVITGSAGVMAVGGLYLHNLTEQLKSQKRHLRDLYIAAQKHQALEHPYIKERIIAIKKKITRQKNAIAYFKKILALPGIIYLTAIGWYFLQSQSTDTHALIVAPDGHANTNSSPTQQNAPKPHEQTPQEKLKQWMQDKGYPAMPPCPPWFRQNERRQWKEQHGEVYNKAKKLLIDAGVTSGRKRGQIRRKIKTFYKQ